MPYYRRNLLILCVTIFLASVSWQQIMPFLPVFLKQIGAQQKYLYRWIGVVYAAHCAGAILVQPIWGKLADRYGRKPMILRAGFCLSFVYLGMSLCQAPWQLTILRFFNGALTGFIPGSFALIATNTPQEHAARSVATAQTASAAGLIVGPAIGGWLASEVGYRSSMHISFAACMLSTLVVLLWVREPNKVKAIEDTSLVQDFRVALRSPIQSSILFVVMILWSFEICVMPYLSLHVRELTGWIPGWLTPDRRVGLLFSLPAVAFFLTAHFWTRVGERRGYDRTIKVGLIGSALGIIVLAATHNLWVCMGVYFLTGLALAAINPSIGALTCTRVDESFRGRAYAIQQAAGTLGALFAPMAASLVATTLGIRAVFVFVGIVFLFGYCVFRPMVRHWPKDESGIPPALNKC